MGTSASVCTVQAVLTRPQPGESPREAFFPPCLCSLPLLVHTQTQQAQGDQIVPSPTAGLERSSHREATSQNLVRMRMGNPEEAPKTL